NLLRKKLLELEDPRFKAYAILALKKMGEKVEVPSLNTKVSLYNGREIVEIEFAKIHELQHL
ncbi:MAG: hypothetical protein QXT07_05460, partial [Archaeoglobaceae archaeon]